MRKLREAAVVAAVIGSAGMIGTGVAAAHGGEQPPVTIKCVQNTGDTSTNTVEVTGLLAVNLQEVLNGGDADSSSNQQVCGLENKNINSNAGNADGGTGLDAL